MRVLPGSHRQELLPHDDIYDPDNMLTRGQEISVDVDEEAGEQDLALALAEIPTLAALEGAQDTPASPADVDLVGAVDETGKAGQAVHLF